MRFAAIAKLDLRARHAAIGTIDQRANFDRSGATLTPALSPRERGRGGAGNPFSPREKVAGASRSDEGVRSEIICRSMRDRRRGGFVDEPAGAKAVEGEGRGERMRLAPSNRMREDMA